MNQLAEAHEVQSSALPSNTESDEDQGLRCWEEVEAETGFSSYKDVLEALEEKGLRFGGLLHILNRYGHRDRLRTGRDSGTIFVINILNNGSTSISLEIKLRYEGHRRGRSFDRSMLESDRKSITPLLQNLRSPPENVPARIVFWSMPRNALLYPAIIDTLGLGLNIHPSFFEALNKSRRPRGSDYIRIGNRVARVARCYRLQAPAPPVLVIAGNDDSYYGAWATKDEAQKQCHYAVEEGLKQRLVKSQIGEGGSLHRWATDRHPQNQMGSKTSGPPNYYVKLFSNYVGKDCSFDSEHNTLLLIALLPLLYLRILGLRSQCDLVRSALLVVQLGVEFPNAYHNYYKQEGYRDLDKQRFWLRRGLEGLEESRDSFVKFVPSQDAAEWLESKTWLSEDENIREALAEARTLDAEVRDYMQLQIGNLSILESRKSI